MGCDVFRKERRGGLLVKEGSLWHVSDGIMLMEDAGNFQQCLRQQSSRLEKKKPSVILQKKQKHSKQKNIKMSSIELEDRPSLTYRKKKGCGCGCARCSCGIDEEYQSLLPADECGCTEDCKVCHPSKSTSIFEIEESENDKKNENSQIFLKLLGVRCG